MQATRWLPKLKKQPRKLTWPELESSLSRTEKIGWGICLVFMEVVMLAVTVHTLYSVGVSPTVPWTMGDGVFLAVCNLLPGVLAGLMLFGLPYNYTVCPQGHITLRSRYSRHCYQCGEKL